VRALPAFREFPAMTTDAPHGAERKPAFGATEIGYLMAAAGAILFSTKGVVIKLAYADGLDAEIVLALRMAFSLPIYAVIAALAVARLRRRGTPLPSWKLVAQAGGVGILGYWFASYVDFLGLELISAQFERLILFTYPLFVVLLGAAFFGQPLRGTSLLAIGVSYIGLLLIFSEKLSMFGSNVAVGAGLVLMAALAFATYQLLAKGVIAQMGPQLFTCIAMSSAGLAAFVSFGFTHPVGDLAVSGRALWLMVFIAIGSTVLPSFLLNGALHRISAQANATIGTLSPVATIIMVVVILGERLTFIDIGGTLLVLAGVGWFTLADRARARG